MTNQSCVCTTSTCPPCMGRCGCAFQKSENGFAVIVIVVFAVLGLLVFARKLLKRRPRVA